MMPQLAKLLREHRMASPYKAETDFVFPAPGGRGRDRRSTGRAVERAVKRAGLGEGVSFHGFRHGFASMLIVELRLGVYHRRFSAAGEAPERRGSGEFRGFFVRASPERRDGPPAWSPGGPLAEARRWASRSMPVPSHLQPASVAANRRRREGAYALGNAESPS